MAPIQTVTARPDGFHIVNLGKPDEIAVSLDPSKNDPNASELIAWLRINTATAWVYSLDQRKATAIAAAKANALEIRNRISGMVSVERQVAWALKYSFASVWAASDNLDGLEPNHPAVVAATGFQIEADITGEDAEALRDRTIEKASDFFMALQLVEGMERLAESEIGGAVTLDGLSKTIERLYALEAQALEKLAALNKGGTNDA